MNFGTKLRAGLLAFAFAVAGTTGAYATTVVLADGQLAESAFAQTGVGIQQELGSEFDGTNGPMTFTGTLSREPGASVGGSRYNLGMTVGNVYFLVHPGCCSGAFRFDSVNLDTSLVSPGSNGGNKSVGFAADASDVSFTVVLNANGSNYDFDVMLAQGSGATFSGSYSLSKSVFGTGGVISSFGAFHNGLGAGYGTLDYSKFSASIVPLPAGLPLLIAGLGLLGVMRRRKTV